MIKIKTAEFYNREYDGPKSRVIFMSFMGSLAFALLLAVVNQAAKIVADLTVSVELRLFLIFLAICAVMIVCKHYAMKHTTLIIQKTVRKVRVRLVDKIRHTELQFLDRKDKGEIYARIVQDTELIALSSPYLLSFFETALSTVVVLFYMAFISITGFVLALSAMIIMNVIFFSHHTRIKENLRTARAKEGDFTDAINDTISGFKEIRINTRKNNALFADIQVLARESERLKIEAEISNNKNIVSTIVLNLMVLATIVFILPVFSNGHNEVVTELVAATLFILGMSGLATRYIHTITKSNVAVENLERLEAEIDSFGTYAAVDAGDIPESFREIRLHAVTFHYTGKEDEKSFTVGPIELDIRQGEVLFIVGGNGSGKSTLLKLLTGLYYPLAGGPITLDDTILTRTNYQAYRELFSVIFTDFHLFKKLYGLEPIDEEQVRHLLKEMDIHNKTDFVDGRFTKLDLSTGQRKRLAYIASLLGDKPIYVFDEWAADQDPLFRRYFYIKFLEDLRKMKKTVIAVTHDDRFFDRADRVIKMEYGQVVEEIRNPGHDHNSGM